MGISPRSHGPLSPYLPEDLAGCHISGGKETKRNPIRKANKLAETEVLVLAAGLLADSTVSFRSESQRNERPAEEHRNTPR